MNDPTTFKGWVDQPDGRGTFDIIWSSFITIFLSTWTCLHLNLPGPDEGIWKPVFRKFRWMVFTIFLPEFTLALAGGQRANARRTTDALHGMGYSRWTTRHSFYANMGGFILQPRDSTPFPIHGIHLVWLVKEGYLTIPEIGEEEIADKSKADLLTKLLVCGQTGWFVVHCLARWKQKLPLTTLELATITFVCCTWGIYGQWLKKPLDVERPTVLKIQASTEEILVNAGPAAAKPYMQTPLDFVWDWHVSWTLDVQPYLHFRVDPRKRPIPRILNDGFPWYDRATHVGIILFMITFYGAIHVMGWNFTFPSSIEKILWRVSGLVILCTTTVFCLLEFGWGIYRAWYSLRLNEQPIRPMSIFYVFTNRIEKIAGANGLPVHDEKFDAELVTIGHISVIVPLVVLYMLARIYVVGEALASLRALPAGAYKDVDWTKFIPHY